LSADQGSGEGAPRQDGSEPREKRSRDRYGRDRAPRGERSEQGDRQERPVRDAQPAQEETAAEPRRSYFATEAESAASQPVAAVASPVIQANVEVAPATVESVAPAPVAAAPVAAPAVVPVAAPAAPTAAVQSMPKLQAFELPIAELAQVAQNSGLNWVNSDAAKIAAVQASIAAEPKPVRVPRERPAAAKADASPLVMVETKRDLRDMTLPFEEKAPQ